MKRKGKECLERWHAFNDTQLESAEAATHSVMKPAPAYEPTYTSLVPTPSSGVGSNLNRSITESGQLAPDDQTPASVGRSDQEEGQEPSKCMYPPTLSEAVVDKRHRQLLRSQGIESDDASVVSAVSEGSSQIPVSEDLGYEDIEHAMDKLMVEEGQAVQCLDVDAIATAEHVVEVYVKQTYGSLNTLLQQLSGFSINKLLSSNASTMHQAPV